MNGKPSVVNVICLVAQKVEELGIHDCHDEIEGVIGIGNDGLPSDERMNVIFALPPMKFRNSNNVPKAVQYIYNP